MIRLTSLFWFFVLLPSFLFGAQKQSIYFELDFDRVPALKLRSDFSGEFQRMSKNMAAYLCKQYPFWHFDTAHPGNPKLRIEIYALGNKDDDITDRPIYMNIILTRGSGRKIKLNTSLAQIYLPGHFNADWEMEGAQLADAFVKRVTWGLLDWDKEMRENLKEIPVATGVLRCLPNYQAELPLDWNTCCSWAFSVFQIYYKTPQGYCVLISYGLGIPSSNEKLLVVHKTYKNHPKASTTTPVSQLEIILQPLHYGQIMLVEDYEVPISHSESTMLFVTRT